MDSNGIIDTSIVKKSDYIQRFKYVCKEVYLVNDTDSYGRPNAIALKLSNGIKEISVTIYPDLGHGRGYDGGEVTIRLHTPLGDIETVYPVSIVAERELDIISNELQKEYSAKLAKKRETEAQAAEERRKEEAEAVRRAEEAEAARRAEEAEAGELLNIVGLNVERVEAKNDYYSHPLILENHMGKNDPLSNDWWGDFPKNQQLFFSRKSPAILLKVNDNVLYAESPHSCIYTITGVLICQEECAPIMSSKTSGENVEFIKDSRSICEQAPTYRELQNRILQGEEEINPIFYILTDTHGEVYYYRFKDIKEPYNEAVLKIDFYQSIVKELKGKQLLSVFRYCRDTENLLEDYYNEQVYISVPNFHIQQENGAMIYNDYYRLLDKNSILCKDIVLDVEKSIVILAILESPDKTATISYRLREDGWESSIITRYKGELFYGSPHFEKDKKGAIITVSGFISESSITEYVSQIDTLKNGYERNKLNKESEEKKRQQDVLTKYGEDFGRKILDHQLAIGMTPDMCKEAVGWPNRTYKKITNTKEIIVYYYAYRAVYFYNGILTQIEEIL